MRSNRALQIEIVSWIREISVQCYVKPIYERKSRNMYIAPATRNLPLSFFNRRSIEIFSVIVLQCNAIELFIFLSLFNCDYSWTMQHRYMSSSYVLYIFYRMLTHVFHIFVWNWLFITLSYQKFMLLFDSRNDYSCVYYQIEENNIIRKWNSKQRRTTGTMWVRQSKVQYKALGWFA